MASRSTARVEARGRGPIGALRIGARVTAMVALLILLLPVHYVLRLLRLPVSIPRHFLRAVAWLAGARVRTSGKPLRRDVVFISNHVSWMDIPALAGATGTAFVSKADVRNAPVVGWLATLNRTVFVERDDRMGVAEQIARLREALTHLWAVTIFPEGTTTDGFGLLPFKASLLAVLEPPPPGVMVQPVLLDYRAAPDIAWVGDEPGLDNALRIFERAGGFPLTIRFLEPFDPAMCDGRKAVAAEARHRILSVMAKPSGPFDAEQLQARRPVWSALSDLFLDTDVSLCRAHDARLLAASPYNIWELERILNDEVMPVCKFNLLDVAGEWAGFDEDWLEQRIIGQLAKGKKSSARSSRIWLDWLALKSEVERLRAGGLADTSPAE